MIRFSERVEEEFKKIREQKQKEDDSLKANPVAGDQGASGDVQASGTMGEPTQVYDVPAAKTPMEMVMDPKVASEPMDPYAASGTEMGASGEDLSAAGDTAATGGEVNQEAVKMFGARPLTRI